MVRGKSRRRAPRPEPRDVTRLAYGGARVVTRRGEEWFVREIPAHRAEKSYRCPGCGADVPPGQAHLVVWSAQHLFGDEAALRERRHWHAHCWRMP